MVAGKVPVGSRINYACNFPKDSFSYGSIPEFLHERPTISLHFVRTRSRKFLLPSKQPKREEGMIASRFVLCVNDSIPEKELQFVHSESSNIVGFKPVVIMEDACADPLPNLSVMFRCSVRQSQKQGSIIADQIGAGHDARLLDS
ncbi:MAG TPA: hypothetical protein VH592_17140 [Gemmataceae bacterium]|jgi:hypothetical protein